MFVEDSDNITYSNDNNYVVKILNVATFMKCAPQIQYKNNLLCEKKHSNDRHKIGTPIPVCILFRQMIHMTTNPLRRMKRLAASYVTQVCQTSQATWPNHASAQYFNTFALWAAVHAPELHVSVAHH